MHHQPSLMPCSSRVTFHPTKWNLKTAEQPHHISGPSSILQTNSAEPTGACRTPVDNTLEERDYHVNYMINSWWSIGNNHHLSIAFYDKIYPCRYIRVCDQMLCPVLNGRDVRRGTEVLCIGTDVDVLMDHDGVMQTWLQDSACISSHP
jgi:hypothetical protein